LASLKILTQISLKIFYGDDDKVLCKKRCLHKRMAWGCRGCDRIPYAEKLAIIRAKIFNIWAKCAATFI